MASQTHVIRAKAGIHCAEFRRRAVYGPNSRIRGKNPRVERDPLQMTPL